MAHKPFVGQNASYCLRLTDLCQMHLYASPGLLSKITIHVQDKISVFVLETH